MLYGGIDVDLDGALVVLHVQNGIVVQVDVHDTPTIEVGAKSRRDYDQESQFSIARSAFPPHAEAGGVLMERVSSLPAVIRGKPVGGPFTNFLRGRANATWVGALIPTGVRRDFISPQSWKKKLGLQGGKENKRASVEKAKALVPEAREHLTLVKHHGRAEAVLLAYLAWQMWKETRP